MRKKQGVLGGLSKTASKMSARAGDLVSDVVSSKAIKRAAGSALAMASSLVSPRTSTAAPKHGRGTGKTGRKRKVRRVRPAAKRPVRQKQRRTR
jgi:hypothetical protein